MFQKEVFAARLRELRIKSQETQGMLGDLLNVSGNHISEMEKGIKTTSFERLCLLCDHFGVSADYLLGRKDEET